MRDDLLPEDAENSADCDLDLILNQCRESQLPEEYKLPKLKEALKELLRAYRQDTKFTVDVKLQNVISPIIHNLCELQAQILHAESLSL